MMKRVRGQTICRTLRKIYYRTDDKETKILIRIAVTMAKKMNTKLEEYKNDWDQGFW